MHYTQVFRTLKATAAVAVLSCAAQASFADSPYYGFGLGYTDAESLADFGGTSSAEYATFGATVGYQWDMPDLFYGAEIDLDVPLGDIDFEYSGLSCDDGANGPYFCDHTLTTRFRGVVGTTLTNGTELFGAFGYAIMMGDAAVSPSGDTDEASVGGLTVGLGAQFPMATGKTRVELIYDNLNRIINEPEGGFEPEFEAISLKATYLFN